MSTEDEGRADPSFDGDEGARRWGPRRVTAGDSGSGGGEILKVPANGTAAINEIGILLLLLLSVLH